MNLIIGLTFVLIAIWGFYAVSGKRIVYTRNSQFAWLTHYPLLTKLSACICLIIATLFFAQQFGNSIAIVALCILSSPILCAFILNINPLENPKKIYAKKIK